MADCPDDGDHDASECHQYGCANYREELEDLAPWGSSPRQMKEWAEG